MLTRLAKYLSTAEQTGNLRSIPLEPVDGLIDLTSNDYLGIANDRDLFFEFYNQCDAQEIFMSSVASRLLSDKQNDFVALENTLADLFHKSCLLFNMEYDVGFGLVIYDLTMLKYVPNKPASIFASRILVCNFLFLWHSGWF